jgi:hypothetical protein
MPVEEDEGRDRDEERRLLRAGEGAESGEASQRMPARWKPCETAKPRPIHLRRASRALAAGEVRS